MGYFLGLFIGPVISGNIAQRCVVDPNFEPMYLTHIPQIWLAELLLAFSCVDHLQLLYPRDLFS